MSVNTDPTHAPDVAESETGSLLQATLVELITLSLIGKRLHWFDVTRTLEHYLRMFRAA